MAFLFDGKYFCPAKNGFYGNKSDYALEKLRIARHYVNLEIGVVLCYYIYKQSNLKVL